MVAWPGVVDREAYVCACGLVLWWAEKASVYGPETHQTASLQGQRQNALWWKAENG